LPQRDNLYGANGEPSHDPEIAARLATFVPYRSLLFSIAYRMLGSLADAEDMVQETFIRWQQASADEVRSPRALLVTIVSRLCINHLQSARVQREEYVGQWLPEPLVTDPENDPLGVLQIDESLSMAFLVLLERLSPVERAVFLLREVFEYEYAEIATTLELSEANSRQILSRARKHVQAVRPRFKASARAQNDLFERFVQAADSGNMDRLVALLSQDVVLHTDGGGKAAALPHLIHGADSVARVILSSLRDRVPKDLVRRVAPINGAPGIVNYLHGKPFSVVTLDIREDTIRAIYVVTNPDKLSHLSTLPLEA